MQTLYYTTNNFIRHTDNIVDLSEYRRKMERMRTDRLQGRECEEVEEETVEFRPHPRRSAVRRERRAALLDLWASMGILVMAVTFTVHVLCL